jgi:hypothetical protein
MAAHAAAMPASCNFRKTLSDYRHGNGNNHGACFGHPLHGHANFRVDSMQHRSPLTPGPLQGGMDHHSANYQAGYTDSYQQGLTAGYNAGFVAAYGNNCAPGYEADYANYAGGFGNGFDNRYRTTLDIDSYVPSVASVDCYNNYSSFNNGAVLTQVDFASQPIVHRSVQLPLPPGVPAPAACHMPPTPAPPMGNPEDEIVPAAPTRGSINHGSGRCKPCAFVFTKGCGNGFECPFCHLCEPGEKKKRRKEKLESRRVMREIRQVFPFSNSGYSSHGRATS